MPKKMRKGRSQSNLSPQSPRYQTLLLRLVEAWELADGAHEIFWDFGPGERPQKILAEFQQIAGQEKIPVRLTNLGNSLRLRFPEKPAKPDKIVIKASDGTTKAEIVPESEDLK